MAAREVKAAEPGKHSVGLRYRTYDTCAIQQRVARVGAGVCMICLIKKAACDNLTAVDESAAAP